MSRARLAFLAISFTFGLAACGEDSAAEPQPESSSPDSTPTPSLEYVESETCRSAMLPLVEIGLANDVDSLGYESFSNRVDQLSRRIDRAVASCSAAVNDPFREAIYEYTAAEITWSLCGPRVKCRMSKIAGQIADGNEAIVRAQGALESQAYS